MKIKTYLKQVANEISYSIAMVEKGISENSVGIEVLENLKAIEMSLLNRFTPKRKRVEQVRMTEVRIVQLFIQLLSKTTVMGDRLYVTIDGCRLEIGYIRRYWKGNSLYYAFPNVELQSAMRTLIKSNYDIDLETLGRALDFFGLLVHKRGKRGVQHIFEMNDIRYLSYALLFEEKTKTPLLLAKHIAEKFHENSDLKLIVPDTLI